MFGERLSPWPSDAELFVIEEVLVVEHTPVADASNIRRSKQRSSHDALNRDGFRVRPPSAAKRKPAYVGIRVAAEIMKRTY